MGRSKKEKKKHRTKSPPDVPVRDKKISPPFAPDKPREHKRKHEAEEEPHKKHKKKKERKRSLSPPAVVRGKKKDRWAEDPEPAASSHARSHAEPASSSRQHAHPHSKHSRSSSSSTSLSPPRAKDVKVKAKAKAKKKKSRAGKGESDSDESHTTKSKKWLSPLKKTLKLKKAKGGGAAGDSRLDEERVKQRSASPKATRRRDTLNEDVVPLPRSHESRRDSEAVRSRGHSSEKRDKKLKVRPSESPEPQLVRSGSTKRGDSSRDASFGRKGRQSESPAVQADRGGSARRGESGRDLPFDRRKADQRDRGEGRKGGGPDERQKRPPSPARQSEMYSPSQLDRESPPRDPSQRQPQPTSRGRQAERDPLRDEERRGQDREGRRGEKFESRGSTAASQDRGGQERFGRRGDGDSFDQYGQDRGQFDADRNRWEYREGRGQEAGGDREQRSRRGDHFERGPSQREQPRSEGMGRDLPFDRQDVGRGSGSREGREIPRDNEERERGRDATRDRGDNRTRDRDGRLALTEGGKYGSTAFGSDGQRRGDQWESGSRSGDWGGDRGNLPRDPSGGRLEERGRVTGGSGSVGSGSSGGRLYRDDGRESGDRRGRDVIAEGARIDRSEGRSDRGDLRLERGDSRLDRGEGRLDRGDRRVERGDNRSEGRLERGEGRLERGDSRGDRGPPRNEGCHDRGDSRLERGDNQLEHRRGEQLAPPMDKRGFRQSRGMGAGPSDGRGGLRGVGSHSPVENRGFEFDRRDVVGGRPGDRNGRMERERDHAGMGQLPPRDRFLPGAEFRRDEPGFRENIPEGGALRDRRVEERFIGHEGMDLPPRGGDRRFDDVREDRMQGRGQGEKLRQDRMMPHRGGHFGRGPGPEACPPPDLLPNQRRGPLLPTPIDEPPRHDSQEEAFEREPPRMGREGPRDGRGRRDQRDADFGPEAGRGGREVPQEGMRDPAWGRDPAKGGRTAGQGGQRDPSGRRGYGDDLPPDPDRSREADSKRRDRDKPRDSPVQDGGSSKRTDKKDGEQGSGGKVGARGERTDASDARSTRSADDVRELTGQRGKEGEVAGGRGGAGALKGVRDRDSRSDGKRSPDPSQGKADPSLPFSGRRQPVRARSLSPKQRSKAPAGEASRSPSRRRSPPSRRGADPTTSSDLASKSARGGRSRTPVGTKRKLEEELRSPRGKDDTKSPIAKRPREDSRSPARKGSRHPSPAGSHHSRGSHSSVERRRRPGLTQREPESRFFGSVHERDSPARRDRERERDSPAWREKEKESPLRKDRDRERDKENKMEKASESSDGSRKRGRSPSRSRGRGSESGDRNRKRWKGDGSWSEAEPGEGGDKDVHKQKAGGAEQAKTAEDAADSSDAGRAVSGGATSSADPGKSSRYGRGEGGGGRRGEDGAQADGYAGRGEDRGQGRSGDGGEGRGESASNQDGADDSKDASLNMLYEDDYEKISSDESDFEADDGEKPTQNIVSVLDIDWASLAKQSTPKPTTGSLQKRFHPANVFRQLGISRALAGDSLFEKVEAICREGVPLEDGKENVKDKENVDQSSETTAAKGVKKMETSLLSDVPVLHMAAVRQKRERTNLLRNLGPFRRALCARRDLEIRRQLCKVDKVYEQPAVFPTHVMDTDLCKLSMQLFRQGRDFVERKDSECDGKIELAI